MKFNYNPTTKAGIEIRLQNLKERTGIDLAPKELTEKVLPKFSRKELWEKYPERVRVYLKMKTMPENLSAQDLKEIEKQKIWIAALNNLGNYIKEHKINGGILEDLQIEVFEAVHNFLETGNKRGKIVLPTGVGKTVIFSQIIKAMNLKSLIAVPTKDLILQTEGSMKRFAEDVSVGKVYTGDKNFEQDVTVTTYKSGKENKDFDFSNYGLVILDEAHKALTSATQEMILKLEEAGAIILEFTATDEYSEDKKIESKEIFRLKTKEAIEQGLLCGVSCVVAKLDVDMSDYLVRATDGYNTDLLEKGLKKYAVYDKAAEMYVKSFDGQNAFMKCASIAGAEDAAKIANLKKKKDGTFVKAVAIHSGLSDEKRKQILEDCIPSEDFPSGKYDILCGVGLIETGLDLPHFSVLLNLEPRFSIIPVAQAGGRVLRLDRRNSDKYAKHATVVDFVFNEKESKNKKPILYAEYLGSTYVLPEKSPRNKKKIKKEGSEMDGEEIAYFSEEEKANLESLKIEGLQIIVESEEIMKVVRSFQEDKRIAPSGWKSINVFSKEINRGVKSITSRFENLKEQYPNDYGFYLAGSNTCEHLSPVLMEAIKENFIETEDLDGWMTIGPLSEALGVSSPTIRFRIIKYRKSNPEWIKMAQNGKRRDEFFSPEMFEALKNEIKPEIKGEWLTISAMRKKGHIPAAGYIIETKLNEVIEKNPTLVAEIIVRGNLTKIYSPVAVNLAREMIASDFAPEGWSFVNKLVKDLSTYRHKILDIVKKYRTTNPEWFKIYRAGEITTEHFSPKLTEIIIKTLKKERSESVFDFEKFKIEVRKTGIGTSSAYDNLAPEKKWPSVNWLTSQDFWLKIKEEGKDPWAELFGENRVVRFYNVAARQSAKEEVKNIMTKKDPSTWKSLEELAIDLKIELSKLQKIMDTKIVGAAHVKEKVLNNKKIKLLSPALQDVIKEEIKN